MVNIQCYMSFTVLIFCSNVFAIPKTVSCSENTKNDCEEDLTDMKLRLVSLVFRHGDRTLDKETELLYPNNPYKNYYDYPDNDGLLTKTGKRRAFQFGQLLRTTYDHFLGELYYPPNVYARSSAIPRTKMTLQLILAALYPPISRRQKWSELLAWQPVNTIYTHISADGLLFPYSCKKYTEAYINILKSEVVKKKIGKFNDTMVNLSKFVGRNMTTIYDLFVLYHILKIQASMNLSLPEWSHDVFPYGKLQDATILQYQLYNYNNELIRLNGGVMLYKIIQDMNGVINGTLVDRKINLFSAHDVNVDALLRALVISNDKVPAFTSSVIVELYEKKGEYFVRILHYLGIPPTLTPVRIKSCDQFCPFVKFVQLISATTATYEDPKCPMTITMY